MYRQTPAAWQQVTTASRTVAELTDVVRSHLFSRRWAGPALLICVATVIFLLATPWGMGVTPDSIFYLGYKTALHPNAPGYSWLLAGAVGIGKAAGLGELTMAAVVNWLLLTLNLLLIWIIVERGTGDRLIATVAGALCLTCPMFIDLHVRILSSALFMSALLASIAALCRHVETGRVGWAVVSAVMAVAATLVRFEGAVLFVLGPLAILFLRSGAPSLRGRDAFLYLAATSASFIIWLELNAAAGGSGTGREFGFFGNLNGPLLKQGVSSILAYVLPSSMLPFVVQIAVLLSLLVLFCGFSVAYMAHWLQRRRGGERPRDFDTLVPIGAVYILGHLMFLGLSSVIEANLPFKTPYMLPIYIVAILCAVMLAAGLSARPRSPAATLCLTALTVSFLSLNVVRTAALVSEFRHDGIFYASPKWMNSETVATAKRLDPKVELVSNGADALTFLASGRKIDWIPFKFDRRTGLKHPRGSYADQLYALRKRLDAGLAAVVILDRIDWRFYQPTTQQLVRDLDLRQVAHGNDGQIYCSAQGMRSHGCVLRN